MCAWKYYNLHLGIPYSKVGTDGINIIIPVLKWKILPFNTNSSRIRAMEDSIWIRARMHWREKLQTPQFTAHNKLCFKNIVLPMRYKVHARQPVWVTSLRITRAPFLFALQQSKKSLYFFVWMNKSLLGSIALTKAQNHVRLKPRKIWHLSKHNGNILLALYIFLLKIVHPLITCMVQWRF